MNEHALILFDTDDDLLLHTNEDGNPLEVIIVDGKLNGWDIFPEIEDRHVLKAVMEKLDPIAIKYSKRLAEMLPDYINATHVASLTANVMDENIQISCVKVKVGIKKYELGTHKGDIDADNPNIEDEVIDETSLEEDNGQQKDSGTDDNTNTEQDTMTT